MKSFLLISIYAAIGLIFLSTAIYLLVERVVDTKDRYPVYMAGKSRMVDLPCGIGINANMTREEAVSLINNPRAMMSPYAAEILEYFDWKLGIKK